MSLYSPLSLVFFCFGSKWRSWHGAWQKPLFQLLIFLRHWLQLFPDLLVIPAPFRAPVGHGHPPDPGQLATHSMRRRNTDEGQCRVGRVLVMANTISVCLSCHTSRQSTTSQSPWTYWTCSRTRGCCVCTLYDAPLCLPIFIFCPLLLLIFHVISFSSGLVFAFQVGGVRGKQKGSMTVRSAGKWCKR